MTVIKLNKIFCSLYYLLRQKKDFGDRTRMMIPTAVREGMREW
jgi:hypothetical protein